MATTTAPRPTIDVSPDAQLHLRERRISVEEYFAMGESGILGEDDRVELLDGRLIDMPPIGPSHSHGVDDFLELFTRRLYADDPPSARVRVQSPIQLDDYSAPEPNIVLYDPEMPKDRHPRPEDICLVVEVADTSVEYDRKVKADHYAGAGIPEYWLVDLPGEAVDVFRQPEDDGYAERVRHRRGEELSVAALPDVTPISVEEIVGEPG
jgi:Uma2 family endonuclease